MVHFSYFNQYHVMYLLGTLVLAGFVLTLPLWCSWQRERVATILGWTVIALNIVEIVYRVAYEGYSWAQVMPLHFCSVSVFMAGVYLISRREDCFQITYYYAFGALLALLLPGISSYKYPLFFQLFMVNHMWVLIGCTYGMIWLGARPTKQGLRLAISLVLVLFPVAYGYNSVYFTNFMFMNAYIIPQAAFIKPFWLYQISLAALIILVMTASYLPFQKASTLLYVKL